MLETFVPFVPSYYVPKQNNQLKKTKNVDFKMNPLNVQLGAEPFTVRNVINS